MTDESDARRDALHAFLQEQGPAEEAAAGALLTGWVVVSSWVSPDGEAWLSKGYAAEVPHWVADGMLHEGLYGSWGDDDDG